jgi:hypothetical protein
MDVGEKIISSVNLGIDKDVFPTKGKLAKKNIVQKSIIRGNEKDGTRGGGWGQVTSGCHGRNRRKWT